MKHTLKIRHKKTANYGIAVNQILFPLGNDCTNINLFFDLHNIYSNKHTKTEKIKEQINSPKTNKVSPKTSTRVKAVIKDITNDNSVFSRFTRVLKGFEVSGRFFLYAVSIPHKTNIVPQKQIQFPKKGK